MEIPFDAFSTLLDRSTRGVASDVLVPGALAAAQPYAGNAHVNLYYLAHLPSILARYGNRGYRLAQLEGALRAGKLHLGTYALGLGAVGSTAFDDEVVEFFSPHASGKAYAFVTVFGQRPPPARRS